MAFPTTTATPTGWVTISSPYYSHLFLEGQALTFTLSASTATSYEVRDYWGTIVASASSSGTTLTIAALPLGWYRLYLRRVTSDPDYGTLIGLSMFSILRSDARFPSPPSPGTRVTANPKFEQPDHAIRGIAMLGPHRSDISHAEDPTTGSITSDGGPATIAMAQADSVYVDQWYSSFQPDSARPRPKFLQFPNGGVATQAHRDGVTATVAACYPTIQYYEGWANEPIGAFDADPTTGYVANATAFYNAVKAGHPDAKVMGPNPVNIGGGPQGTIGAALDQLFAAAGDKFDAISFHAYNMADGDLALGRRVLTSFQELLTRHGLQNVELWQTEWGCFGVNGGPLADSFNPGTQTRWVMVNRFLLEQYGIPKERDCYFYDTSHGFWSFAGWWKNGDGTILPMIPLMRVYSQEVWGKTWTAALDFGAVENDHFIGNRFDAADGTSVLAILAAGRTDGSVTLGVQGAGTVEVVGPFGAVTTVPVIGGRVTVTPGEIPVYVREPAGVTVTVLPRAYGWNVVQWGASIPNQADDASTQRRLVNDVLENRYFSGPAAQNPTEYRDDTALPNTVTVELRNARRIDTIVVHAPYPWNDQTAPLDFDIEYRTPDDIWHVAATIVESETSVPCLAPAATGGTSVDVFYSGRHVFVASFTPVVADAVRLTVRNTTIANPEIATRIAVREIAVYCQATQA